jgi:hypothetical protein
LKNYKEQKSGVAGVQEKLPVGRGSVRAENRA